MRATRAAIGVLAVGILIMACSLPQVGVGPDKQGSPAGTSAGTDVSGGTGTISVTNDASRNVAVYSGPSGTKEDIIADDPATGQGVSCVHATSFTVIAQTGNGDPLPLKVLVVGERGDGSPGAWEIHSDGKIDLVESDGSGRDGDLSPGEGEAPDGMHGRFGWVYHVTAVSADGKMIVGYAENPKGFTRGRISIPVGTTVGVYWKVARAPRGRHVVVSPPLVIGSWDIPKGHGEIRAHRDSPLLGFLSQLKLFFLDKLQSYLVMATAVHYDAAQNDYVVTGTDENGNAADAAISPDGAILITEVQSTPSSYSEIVIDTYFPTGTGYGFQVDVMSLFSATGVASSQNPWTNPGAGALAVDGETGCGSNPNASQQCYAYIDYKPPTPLPSGTVLYVRINGYSPTSSATGSDAAVAPYALRVLTAPSSTYSYYGANAATTAYEPDDTPISGGVPTNPIAMTPGQSINCYLSPAGDVDWVKITLP